MKLRFLFFSPFVQIWNHPDVLFEALQKENLASDQDLDLDDITGAGPARCAAAPNQKPKSPENPPPIGGLSLNQLQEKANQVITYEWVRPEGEKKTKKNQSGNDVICVAWFRQMCHRGNHRWL